MSVIAPKQVPDGLQNLFSGVNSGIAPNTLAPNQLAWLVNGTLRGGFARTRPAWKRCTLEFDASQSAVEDGLFQGASPFSFANQLVLKVAGRFFSIDVSTFNVNEITPDTGDNPALRRAWYAEAEDFLTSQDGQSAPLIYNGASARRANSHLGGDLRELPTGTVMEYSQGRLGVVSTSQRSFTFGDLVYGPTGTSTYGRRDALLKWTENDVIAEGGAFTIGMNAGRINAMRSPAQLDTSLGQGPLQVMTEIGSASVALPFDRTTWQSSTSPLQAVSLLGDGAVSDWATVNVNGDLWFRSLEGVRSFAVARRDFGTWTNTDLSKEVERVLRNDDRNLLGWCSAALFDKRFLMTCAPYRVHGHGIVWRGLVVLNFNLLSGLTGDAPPVWEGLWTGLNILQIVSGVFSGVRRCFIFALSTDDKIQLWELATDALYDNDGTDDKLIDWIMEMPAYNWKDGGWSLKQLEYADIWYDELSALTTFTARYRSDAHPNWNDWHTWTSCWAHETCGTADCITPVTLGKGFRSRERLPTPPDVCSQHTNMPTRRGYEIQPRLEIKGPARVKKFRLFASDVAESVVGDCATERGACPTSPESACPRDDFAYSIATATNVA